MNNLTEEQRAAATTLAKRVLVTACPGSGKTQTFAARIRHMIDDQKVLPSTIAAITFTRLGATEIRERVGQAARGAFIGTLHSFCLRMLREMGGQLGYEPEWLTIMDDVDAELDMKEVLCDMGFIRKKPKGGFDWLKVGSTTWDDFVMGVTSGKLIERRPEHVQLWLAWDAFRARCRAQNQMTFGLILYEAMALLDKPEALAYFQNRHRHIMIDEFQDTDCLQWSIVLRLAQRAEPDTLWACGDEDQSIYAFRGAEPHQMVAFAAEPTTEVHHLTRTFRFGPKIATAASNLISHNKDRIDKGPMVPNAIESTLAIRTINHIDAVSTILRGLTDKGYAPNEIAVLCRQHRMLDELRAAHDKQEPPLVKIGHMGFMKNQAEYRAVMGYLRLACNPYDRRAFMSIAATEHISPGDMLDLREKAVTSGIPLPAAYGRNLPKTLPEIQDHVSVVDPHADYRPPITYLSALAYTESLKTTRDIIDAVAMSSVQDEMRLVKQDSVVACTIHAAKGLQWKAVVIIGMDQSILPSGKNPTPEAIEEERRLAFVAITRAKETAILCTRSDYEPSMFLEELSKTG